MINESPKAELTEFSDEFPEIPKAMLHCCEMHVSRNVLGKGSRKRKQKVAAQSGVFSALLIVPPPRPTLRPSRRSTPAPPWR